jgi:hypothetical protein
MLGKIEKPSSNTATRTWLAYGWIPTMVFLFACNLKPDPCGPNDPERQSAACESTRDGETSSPDSTQNVGTDGVIPICASQNPLPTWESPVSQFVKASCSGSSCHAFASTYDGFENWYNTTNETGAGRFESYLKSSHYNPRVPQSQYDMLKCWIALGLP